ncbi:unnamed protein product [Dibothriocephalus latus]|uniref:Uncharacterized protein n=1 Tax=Dibothriocephalus latus TaxID=60516 RepID=A0A3P6P1J1_DIBLA|nr:unnamed protein product [Dibothriocephalus latus]
MCLVCWLRGEFHCYGYAYDEKIHAAVVIPNKGLQPATSLVGFEDPLNNVVIDPHVPRQRAFEIGENVHNLELGTIEIYLRSIAFSTEWWLAQDQCFVRVDFETKCDEEVHAPLRVLFCGGVVDTVVCEEQVVDCGHNTRAGVCLRRVLRRSPSLPFIPPISAVCPTAR